jgi:putative hemolysin
LDYHSVGDVLHNLPILAITPTGTIVLIISAVILFVISFIVSGSEVAFFSLTYKDINMLKSKQKPAYRRIVNLLESPKTLLASMLIANSFLNIGIILILNVLMRDWIDHLELHYVVEFLIKVVIVTSAIVLFGKVLPKVWATHHKITFATEASLTIEVFNSIFSGLSKRLVKFSDRIENRFNPKGSSGMDNTQLDYAIDLLPEHEATKEEKQILKGIRKFSDTTVKQTMRTRLDVSGVGYNCNFRDVVKKIEELHYSRLPVFKSNLDEIEGILHTKDVLPYLNEDESFDWHKLMRPPFYVHEQKLIEDLLQEFRAKRTHMAVVVDEFGGTSGIITLEDIMEEIIGDIQDEFDDEENVNKKIDENNYIFEGRIMINDMCKKLNLPVDTFDEIRGDSDSLAGLVLEIAGEFPEPNAELQAGDFIFIPLEINKNRIEKIKVTIKQPSLNEEI